MAASLKAQLPMCPISRKTQLPGDETNNLNQKTHDWSQESLNTRCLSLLTNMHLSTTYFHKTTTTSTSDTAINCPQNATLNKLYKFKLVVNFLRLTAAAKV